MGDRLISADALTGCVSELYEYDLCHTDADDYTEGRASAEHYILEKIREQPTIDAIPVEWLKEQIRPYTGDVSDIGKSASNGTIKGIICRWRKEQEAR